MAYERRGARDEIPVAIDWLLISQMKVQHQNEQENMQIYHRREVGLLKTTVEVNEKWVKCLERDKQMLEKERDLWLGKYMEERKKRTLHDVAVSTVPRYICSYRLLITLKLYLLAV